MSTWNLKVTQRLNSQECLLARHNPCSMLNPLTAFIWIQSQSSSHNLCFPLSSSIQPKHVNLLLASVLRSQHIAHRAFHELGEMKGTCPSCKNRYPPPRPPVSWCVLYTASSYLFPLWMNMTFFTLVCNFTEFTNYHLHMYGQISGFLMTILNRPVLGHWA